MDRRWLTLGIAPPGESASPQETARFVRALLWRVFVIDVVALIAIVLVGAGTLLTVVAAANALVTGVFARGVRPRTPDP